jgi:hypothetical protein
MATTPQPTPAVQQFLQPYESDLLRSLLILRQQANDNVKTYLLQILGARGLDPNKYGVSPDLRTFTEIQAPVATPVAEVPTTDAPAAPAAAV